MNVSENKELKKEPSKNEYLVPSQEKIENISEKDIKISNPNQELPKDNYQNELKEKNKIIDELKTENQKITLQNKLLLVQLQKFSKKLDEEIQKREQSHPKKAKSTLKPEEKEKIEIQNLYKKIEIYKKENSLLKSKISNENEVKFNDSENKLKIFMQENEELKSEIKSLKKIIKMQEKGLSDIGAEGFLKMTSENDKMKEEIRKLRIEIDQVERKYRTIPSQNDKQLYTPQGEREKVYFQRIGLKKEHTLNQKSFQSHKKNISLYRPKTETSSVQKDSISKENESELNLNKENKILEKYESKIRGLNAEKLRQKEIIENLKIQIIQKDKEIDYLREKIEFFRKTPKVNRAKQNPSNQSVHDETKNSKIFFMTEEVPSFEEKSSKIKKNKKESREIEVEETNESIISRQNEEKLTVINNRYPRIEDRGLKSDSAYRWNHHQFSSKIKEIQALVHPSGGHIQYIHVRYEKGEPQKSNESNNWKFSALVCEEFEEFVTQIRGGFKNKYLQYIALKTNGKRVAEFGNVNLEKECDNFSFSIQSNEYPCALFGENEVNGVTRLGCFIEKL